MRVASLSLNKDTYNINSPWSNQIVAWRQIAWDGQWPAAEAKLYRPSVSKVVSEWDTLEWYVGTRYKLIVDWEDNVAMSSMNLSREWKVLTGKSLSSATGSISIDIDIHTKAGTETFVSKWVDQFGNEVEKTITMTFLVPDIDITDIAQNPDGESVSITAEISQDIDQWNVTFQRKRWTSRKSMVDDYPLWPWDTIVVWGPYSMGGGIAMYGKNWDSIASVDPDTAEIKINSWYKDDYEIRAIVEDGALLKIYDKKNNKSVFSLSIPAKECVKFEAKNFNVVDLPEKWKMGEFNWWKAVYNNWTNVLFASPTCHLYSEFWLEWTYDFDRELQAVVLTLYLPSDLTKKNPIKVWFKAKPFENK